MCLSRLHESTLDSFAPVAEEALRLLAKLPDAPKSVREVFDPRPLHTGITRSPEVVPVSFNSDTFKFAKPGDWLPVLVAGGGTPSCLGDTSPDETTIREVAARTAVAAWFTGELKPLPHFRSARAAGLSCQGDQLAVLTGGAL